MNQWTGSDHDLAMDHATPETVLGDFSGVQLEHYGITSRMFQRDGKFFVNTEGPDGKMADFEVKYVLGVKPLQQYMVEFDRPADLPEHEIARLQVLRTSWDTEKKEWFYLSPPDVDEKLAPDDPLHWTRAGQNWNHMCADCHSTNLGKNYDPKTQIYHTTFSEIDVSCETCHGPGSVHIQLANSNSLFWDRQLGYGLKKLKNDDSHVEIETCAPCHSRRHHVFPDDPPGQNYYDCFANELLTPTTYYADGQILDEVYVYGSFIQSKMYHNNVRCSDCHDPHTTRIKQQGNALCTSCHTQHPVAKYDTPAHHRHNAGSAGAQCVECHMPATPFMDVDLRRDHSLRIPRPDLSVDLGTPNACTACHLDINNVDAEKRSKLTHYSKWLEAARAGDEQIQAEIDRADRWSAEWVEKWYGKKAEADNQKHFAYTLSAAWQRDQSAVPDLLELARSRRNAAIVRASALAQLSELAPQQSWDLSAKLLEDGDPQVRTAAIRCLETLPQKERLKTLTPMLEDRVRSVRIEAARVLAGYDNQAFKSRHLQLRNQGLDEYRRGLMQHSDQSMSHMGLGLLAEAQRDFASAATAYRTAIRVQPDVSGPRTNLAALLEQQGRDDEVARLRKEELKLLERDARLAPESAGIQYRYGLALYLQNRMDEAVAALEAACRLEPKVADFHLALTLLYQRLGRLEEALSSVEELLQLDPNNQGFRNIQRELRGQR